MKYFYFSFTVVFALFLFGCSEQAAITDVGSGNLLLPNRTISKVLPENINSHILVNSSSKNPATGAMYYVNGKIMYSYSRTAGKYELKTTIALSIREILLKRVTVYSLNEITFNEGETDDKKPVMLTNEYDLSKDINGTLSLCLDYQVGNYVTLISSQVK